MEQIEKKLDIIDTKIDKIDEKLFESYLSTAGLPAPDFVIRAGGEMRMSNFVLWQAAYAELYFTATLWPDFDQNSLEDAIKSFRSRQRRFGHTSEQVLNKSVTL